jgi:hypothetical protein
MPESFHIPEEMTGAFNRLMNRIAPEHRENESIRRIVLSLLKIGGEPLSRQWTETIKKSFPDAASLFKRPTREISAEDDNASETVETASEEALSEGDNEPFDPEMDDDIADPSELD